MPSKRYSYRIYLLTATVLVACGVLLTKLYDFQINHQPKFRSMVPSNYEVKVREPGVRGEITDRHGITLAQNTINYQLSFNLREIQQDYLQHYRELPEEQRPEAFPDIVTIINQWVRPHLAKQGVDNDYSAKALEAHYNTHGGLVPFVFKDNLSYDQMAHFSEHNLALPGVYVMANPRRHYPYQALASHTLGYLKQWEKGDIPPQFKHYVGDPKGIAGVESTMDSYLRGSEGVRTILKNEKGKNLRVSDYQPPAQGSQVELTIDARIQYLTETVLRRAGRAAAVVLDVRNGEILAMASVPDFDPNDFIPNISVERYSYYRDNPSGPFLNRAISTFPPGSTFKLPAALAAAANGIHDTECDCIGYTTYGKAKIRCWKTWGHGELRLQEAIQVSCNPYFMKLANLLGSAKMVDSFNMFGFGSPTGVQLPRESSGIITGSKAWQRRNRNNRITPALNGMLSIGQGDAEATPLQMATLVGGIANGGTLYHPRIIRRVIHPELGEQIKNRPRTKLDLTKQGITTGQIEDIRLGMHRAAHKLGGTARLAAPTGIEVGAKTGTAQTSDLGIKTHVAWTVAFAPFEEPRYAVAVAVKRGGSGGKVAAPLVKLILNGIFAKEAGQRLPLDPLEPYIGNTDLIAEISIPENNALMATFMANGESGDEASSIVIIPTEPEPEDENIPTPSIRPEVDTRGTLPPRAIPVSE
ncbi:penicillin-binding protein 2 [Rubritalea marina]|uniref:penicillin-binding protein 2 n=1 Tax=Rubritalea marina TaxID=361055 RepID=UPI0003659F36|nr:penicillin-binding protein 2 [Rubritalea marina]